MTPKRVRTVEGSCWLCKDRRVICDLQQPRCSRCVSKGQLCEYGEIRLRWCNGVAARGRFAGQNLPVSVPGRGKWKKQCEQISPLQRTESLQKQEDDQKSSDAQQLAIINHSTLQVWELSSLVTPEHLMLYFEKVVVDRFSLSTDQISINLTSVYEEPALRDSVSAVANAHHVISERYYRQDASLIKKRARWNAIHNFRTRLQCPNTLRASRASALNLFMANVLLCILDGVIDPHDEDAATYWHYLGGRAILSQWGLQKQLCQHKRGLPALMLSVFATMDLTYSMLSGEQHYFSPKIWTGFADSDGWWGILPEGDPFLQIMSILSRLAELGSFVRKGPSTTNTVSNEELRTLLMALRGRSLSETFVLNQNEGIYLGNQLTGPLLSFLDLSGHHLDADQSWVVFCNAYRLTGLIYAFRVFYQLSVSDPLVQLATSVGVQAICKTRLAGKLSHCLLFPALVIGSHCRTEEDQTALLNTMKSTAAFLRFGSLRVMESFLNQIWQQNSEAKTWWECFEPISKKAFLF